MVLSRAIGASPTSEDPVHSRCSCDDAVDSKCRLPCLITGEGWTKDFEGNQLVCICLQIYAGSDDG